MSRFADADLCWSRPENPTEMGVLVLAGSSGRLDVGRAEVLAAAGATALAVRWFAGEGQPAVPCEVPLETFTEAIDLLATQCAAIGVLGLSYGAEAALLTAVRDARVKAVVALAPSDVAWEGQHQQDDDPRRSKWTWQDGPVPFVPLNRTWLPSSPQPAFAPLYAQSRREADPSTVEAATIPVELFLGDLVLVAGGRAFNRAPRRDSSELAAALPRGRRRRRCGTSRTPGLACDPRHAPAPVAACLGTAVTGVGVGGRLASVHDQPADQHLFGPEGPCA